MTIYDINGQPCRPLARNEIGKNKVGKGVSGSLDSKVRELMQKSPDKVAKSVDAKEESMFDYKAEKPYTN